MGKRGDINRLAALRERAEKALEQSRGQFGGAASSDSTGAIIQELRTYQIELEMQNDELQKAQLELQDMVEKYADLYDSSPVGYVSLDEKNIVREANLTAAELLGLERKHLINKRFSAFIEPSDQDIFYHHRRLLVETGGKEGCELRLMRKNGSIFFAELESVLKEDASGAPQVRCSLSDISQRKLSQQQLIQSSKLASIGTFVAGVAHELNNPLTPILGYAEGLIEREDLPEDVKKDLQTIYDQSQRCVQIVRHLLDFTKKRKEEKSTVWVNNILENVLALNAYCLKEDDVEVVVDYSASLPTVLGNINQLQQVFMTLIVNAHYEMMKHSEKKLLRITAKATDSSVVIIIENYGGHINQENLSRIFDPFFTTNEVGEGEGLGLYLAFGIVQNHGGTIIAENITSLGVRFTVTLPIQKKFMEKNV